MKITPGEFVFVVGASGAGKSTFLKLLRKEEAPSSGSITVNSIELNTLPKREIPFYRRTLGIVFQDYRLIPKMTVFDNIAFAMRVVGTREKEIRKRVPYVISLVGLSNKARCFPETLSGGEQQRVGLARALANNAELLIADEPTGNVDPQMSYEIVELLTQLNEKGTTIIMVTHEHNLVSQFDRRVIELEKGVIVSDGKNFRGRLHDLSNSHLNDFSGKSFRRLAAEDIPAATAVPELSDFSIYLQDDGTSLPLAQIPLPQDTPNGAVPESFAEPELPPAFAEAALPEKISSSTGAASADTLFPDAAALPEFFAAAAAAVTADGEAPAELAAAAEAAAPAAEPSAAPAEALAFSAVQAGQEDVQ